MEIRVNTKYDKGDIVWTDGWEIGGKDSIPVPVEVHWVEVSYVMQSDLPQIRYGLIPVGPEFLNKTLKDPYRQSSELHATTDFPEDRPEEQVFSTFDECKEFIDNSLPF